jgi:hypothetical protein
MNMKRYMETLVNFKKLQVLSPPEVLDMEKRVVAGGSGLLAELSCTIAGDPRPKVGTHFTSNAGANNASVELLRSIGAMQVSHSNGVIYLLTKMASACFS